ncbi:SSY5 [[Candida] subhashii]|uniref:SSY5 n=1 Tax=[Candida] subhashii TaxID=561895 RepID=A0A8J5UEA3_9ASCO|nr:SSY5 [[Candida] subhashii]KAG7660963.1 SSY5 [[Candida] subhashii]
MSMSLSVENSTRTSGTMGGYIYPIINLSTQPHLQHYANSKFAISCGHVCLDGATTVSSAYPHVSCPSSVLISLYKSALMTQYQKANAEAKVAYGSVLTQLGEMFPLKRVKVTDPKSKTTKEDVRNLPKLRFGQIIWGERTLIKQDSPTTTTTEDNDPIASPILSDLAIIKINKNLQCQNYLGDDIPFNEYDPSLILDNLYVRKIIPLNRFNPKPIPPSSASIDTTISGPPNLQTNFHGISVFKYGSTTKYTTGNLNGIKLVYWQDGAIHSSEYIINSPDNLSAFASGGDSGSWILTKLEDIGDEKGLGVVGMLHSYDGAGRQFGLFSPMCEILERLEDVTGIKWGVVGCPAEKGMSDGEVESTEEEEEEDVGDESESESDDDDDESSIDGLDGAVPPGID